MNQLYHYTTSFIVCLLLAACSSSTTVSSDDNILTASALHPFGRVILNSEDHIELIGSAAHVGFTFSGTTCDVIAYVSNPNEHNYLQYELDGVYQKRIKISGNSKTTFTITAPTDGDHTVWLYKATEAHSGPIYLEKITGESLKPLKRPEAPLIEFIGNSITCGAAADPSEVPCGTGVYHDQHNAYMAYGPRVARALNVNFILSSVSGIGVYRNWNTDGPTMPQVYAKADFQETGERMWDFSRYSPDIVSIALGTNDFSNGDGQHERLPFDSTSFVSNYVKFIQQIKSHYDTAQIALLSSAMVKGDNRIILQNCLTSVKQQVDALYPTSKPVAIYFFNPMQPKGCTGHPSVEDHAILAEEVSTFFKTLIAGEL